MKKFFAIAVVVCLGLGACKETPTTPSKPSPTSTGVIVTSPNSNILVGQAEQMTATVSMSDGTTRPGIGQWNSGNPGVATVDQAGLVRGVQSGGVDIFFADTTAGQGMKTLTVRTLWSRSGAGANVFDMPTYVTRVKITGTYTGQGENFVVYIAGHLIVNEILGTSWNQTYFEGTYLTSGGVVEIKYSNGLSWSFTEVR